MVDPNSKSSLSKKSTVPTPKKGKVKQRQSAIPRNVANRMARRIAFTTGIPTATGMGVFIASYVVVSRGIADIAPILTLFISASCFLIGLLGLSFGLFSASWEEEPGSFLGLENIRPNIDKVRSSFNNRN